MQLFPKIIIFTIFQYSTAENTKCGNFISCSRCISVPECSWCGDIDNTRCFDSSSDIICDTVINPKNSITIVQDIPLDGHNFMTPQKVDLKLRKGVPLNVTFKAAQLKQYPVDIYFLLDSSWSMKKARESFAEQAEQIIRGIPRNRFRI